jgi:hypothetical protein
MAYDGKPSTWIASWSEDGTNVTFPIASMAELTAAEADATTGDIRKVAFAIAEVLFQKYNSLAAADRPTKMTISKSSSVNTSTGVMTNTYTLTFSCAILTQDVAAES